MNTILTDDELKAIYERHPDLRFRGWNYERAIEAAVLAKLREQEPVAWLVCSINKDGSPSLEYAAAWKEAAHEHINDAITQYEIEDAASWVVRPAYAAPLPAVVQVPLFYYRPTCNGEMYEGPIWAKSVGAQMLMAERPPGSWKPLYAAPLPAVVQVPQVDPCVDGSCSCCWTGSEAAEAPAQTDALQEALDSLSFYKRRFNALHKAQVRMRDPERVMVCDILANGMLLEPPGNRYEAPAQPSVPAPWREATEQDAYEMGAKGAPATEQERKLFEAWMRGHCWALSAHWDGKQYVGDEEAAGGFSAAAMATRRLWAAWRDRAALAQLDSLEGGE